MVSVETIGSIFLKVFKLVRTQVGSEWNEREEVRGKLLRLQKPLKCFEFPKRRIF